MTHDVQVTSLTRLLLDAHRRLALRIGFRLWDGSRVPADWPAEDLMITIADPGAVASWCAGPCSTRSSSSMSQGVWTSRTATSSTSPSVGRRARPRAPCAASRSSRRSMWRAASGLSTAARRACSTRCGATRSTATASRPPTRPTSPTTTTSRTTSTGSSSTGRWSTPARIFTEDHGDIDRAQFDKLDMICRKLRLKPGDRFLDIGCGWGALVCHAAEHYGVEAHGVTLARSN